MRVQHTPSNKTPEVIINKIQDNINSFPYCESHYACARTFKNHLGPELSTEKMYKLFISKYLEENIFKKGIAKL